MNGFDVFPEEVMKLIKDNALSDFETIVSFDAKGLQNLLSEIELRRRERVL